MVGAPYSAGSTLAGNHCADRFHCRVEALRNGAVGRFEPARTGDRMVKRAGEPRPIDPETMNLFGEVATAAVPVETIFDGFLQRLQGTFKSGRRRLHGGDFYHFHPSRPPSSRAPKPFSGRQMEREAYVVFVARQSISQ